MWMKKSISNNVWPNNVRNVAFWKDQAQLVNENKSRAQKGYTVYLKRNKGNEEARTTC